VDRLAAALLDPRYERDGVTLLGGEVDGMGKRKVLLTQDGDVARPAR
jgi:hypothetical protein